MTVSAHRICCFDATRSPLTESNGTTAECPSKMLTFAREIAIATPPERNRVVDLVRVGSILVVVFGHWLMAAITFSDGEIVPGHLLDLAEWTHPLTWIFQVMPLFFFVGGYSNARSLRSARKRGESYGRWLRSRLRRLTLPVVPLLLVWMAGGWLGLRLGLDWEILQLASRVALVPTWFLAAYVVIVTLAPAALILWERLGWWSVVVGVLLAAAADWISIGGGVVWVGFLNYVFVWGSVHQLGYAWVDGSFRTRGTRWLLGTVGLAVTFALVTLGPYPTAMVGLDTAEVTNSYPPRVTLIFLGIFQAGARADRRATSCVMAVEAQSMDRSRPRQRSNNDALPVASHRHGDSHRPLTRGGRIRIWDRATHGSVVGHAAVVVLGAGISHVGIDRPRWPLRAARYRRPPRSGGVAADSRRRLGLRRAGTPRRHRNRGRGRAQWFGAEPPDPGRRHWWHLPFSAPGYQRLTSTAWQLSCRAMPTAVVVADGSWVTNEVRSALALGEWDIREIADPREVVEQLGEVKTDAVIVDMQVGSMGGMALIRAIRQATDATSRPRLVLLLDRAADRFLAGRAGADAAVRKPINAQELRTALATIEPGDEEE